MKQDMVLNFIICIMYVCNDANKMVIQYKSR